MSCCTRVHLGRYGRGAVAVLLATTVLAGCVRFNKFYNATRDFADAERLRHQRGAGGRPSPTESKKYQGCISRCEDIITEHSGSGFVDDCILLVGKSLLWQGEYAKAESWLERLGADYPGSPHTEESLFFLGKVARLDGRPSVAASRLIEFLKQHPDSESRGEALLELVMSLVQAGRTDSALVVGRRALENDDLGKVEDRLRFEVGRLLLEAGEWEAAERLLARAADGDDRALRFEAALLRGSALEDGGRFGEAVDLYESLERDARADSQIAKAGLALAHVHLSQGRPEEALGKLGEIVELFPRTPQASEAHYRMGRIYVSRHGDFEKAEEHFSKASQGRRVAEKARAALESTKQLMEFSETLADSDAAALWLRAGECYLFVLEVPDSAVTCYRRAASLNDSLISPRAHLALARLLQQMGLNDEASEALEDLLAAHPMSQQAAEARMLLGEPEPDPPDSLDDPESRYVQAEQALLSGDYEVAAELFDELAASGGDQEWAAKARFASAWTLQEKLGRTGEALRNYEVLADSFPESTYGREAALRLGISIADTVQADSVSSAQPHGAVVARCDTTGFGELQAVRVRVRVLPDGRAAEVRVQDGSGSLACDEKAQEAARRARYAPARTGETAVEGWWEGLVEVYSLYVEQPPDVVVLEPEESELDSLPAFTLYRSPTYPPGLLALAEGEEVVLALDLDEEGGVTSTRIEEAPEAIRQIVLQTVGGWRFRAAYREGVPTASKIRIAFRVEGDRR